MSTAALIVAYGLMLAFDLSVLAGTAYLIAERNWSAWWMVLAILLCAGSNPRTLIATWNGCAA